MFRMKYARLTNLSEIGTLHALDINGEEQPLCELTALDTDILIGRLYELENKIESGELCDREEVRKETAKEILQELYNRLELVSEDGLHTMMVCNTHLFDLAKQFNIELEDEV